MRFLQYLRITGGYVDHVRILGAGLVYFPLPLWPLHNSVIIIINMVTTIMITTKAVVSIMLITTNNKYGFLEFTTLLLW